MTSLKDIKEQIIKIKTDITDIDIAERQQEQIIKIKTDITDIDITERQQEQIIKIKTDITDIDIAESKIQLKNKSATEPKRGRRNQLNPREGEGTN